LKEYGGLKTWRSRTPSQRQVLEKDFFQHFRGFLTFSRPFLNIKQGRGSEPERATEPTK